MTPTPPPDPWDDWVSATRTRHFMEEDPLLDWLDRYGADHGFTPDTDLPTYDPRTDFRAFILAKGIAFEDGVMALIRQRLRSTRIADGPADSRDTAKVQATIEAMRAGVPVIEQAVLHDPHHRTYGIADLLVRSDQLNALVPDTLTEGEAHLPAPGLGSARWHYCVIDIKFKTLELLRDGGAASDLADYMAQVWIYNEALARTLGMQPAASYLLGRGWKQGDDRGDSCFERLARVDHARLVSRDGEPLAKATLNAVDWIRRMRREGAGWQATPTPSVPELYPHMRQTMDQPWHSAKQLIATELKELTLLPRMNPQKRRDAHAIGIMGWTDPRANSASLGITTDSDKADAVLRANRDQPQLIVVPEQIERADPAWRTPAANEFLVDFETVSNLADDFSQLPQEGGQPLIFQIGCGRMVDGRWQFVQWTTKRLTEADEATIIDAWLASMQGHLADARIYHWSAAETSNLDSAYNSAKARHPDRSWPDLPWFDLLNQVVRAEPVAVRGAFNFGLKSVVKGMHAAGLVETTWTDGPTDGLGAMIGAWWCDAEAERTGVTLPQIEMMAETGRYNEVDCRSMAEVLGWLRENR